MRVARFGDFSATIPVQTPRTDRSSATRAVDSSIAIQQSTSGTAYFRIINGAELCQGGTNRWSA